MAVVSTNDVYPAAADIVLTLPKAQQNQESFEAAVELVRPDGGDDEFESIFGKEKDVDEDVSETKRAMSTSLR